MIDKKTLELWDKKYFWHPFTQMKVYEEEGGIIFERGEGVYLYDIEGNKYIDAVSSLWCNIHGHNHPKLNEALINQLKKVAHTTALGNSNVSAILLSKKLIDIAPKCLSHVFYSEDGAEAMEIAIKLSYHYFKNKGIKNKNTFLSFSNAYHGDTLGAVSVGGVELFHKTYEELLFKTIKLPSPYLFCKKEFGDINESCRKALANMIKEVLENNDNIVAFSVESALQAAAGFYPYPKGLMKDIRDLTKKYGVLMIVDEVATGFGRTGTMFYVEQEEVCPDLMALGKGISGGYLPLAATLTSHDIYEAFYGDFSELKHFFHGHTYTANNLACAVSLKNIELFEEEKTLFYLKDKISFLDDLLKEFEDLDRVKEVRGVGFLKAIELIKDKEKNITYDISERVGFKVANKLKEKGIFLRPLGNNIVLVMPLVIKKEEIEKVVSSLKEVLKSL